MGEATINNINNELLIKSVLFFYGDAATAALSKTIAEDVAHYWNEANGIVQIKHQTYTVRFLIEGVYAPGLQPDMVFENDNPQFNYFRVEDYASGNISFVDGVGSNTGYFKLDNLLDKSTTAAHEYGHTIGLHHPPERDIRGKGTPGIMYPRGTIVDKPFQYSPTAEPLAPGGTINPHTRKVLQEDIDNLKLHRLSFDGNGAARVGEFSSVWHEKHTIN